MVNFQVKLDERFDELMDKNSITLAEIISLKSYIIDIYMMDNYNENMIIRKDLKTIDLKI